MHLRRWLTGIIALPLLVVLIWKGGSPLFAMFIGIVCVVCLWEYARIVFGNDQGRMNAKAIPSLLFIAGPVIIWAAHASRFDIIVIVISVNLVVAGLLSLFRFESDKTVVDTVARQVGGIVYIPLFLSCLVMMRRGDSGIQWVLFLLCMVFAGDTAALYAGTYLGRHKLCPAISPGKTVEGAIGGLAASIALGSLYKVLFLPALSWKACLVIFPVVFAAALVGDLFESELKRVANVKDSGKILPGHGGLLDRIDALLFAAPVTYVLKTVVLHP